MRKQVGLVGWRWVVGGVGGGASSQDASRWYRNWCRWVGGDVRGEYKGPFMRCRWARGEKEVGKRWV